MEIKIGRTFVLLLGMSLASHAPIASGDPYYTGNPYTPDPPGCVTMLQQQSELVADRAQALPGT